MTLMRVMILMMRLLVMLTMMTIRAPNDCLQYFTGKTGTVYSYNFAGAQVSIVFVFVFVYALKNDFFAFVIQCTATTLPGLRF